MDWSYLSTVLTELLAIDSPSGMTQAVMEYIEGLAGELGLEMERNKKGCGIITVPGESGDVLGVSAHVDTLGLIVRGINDDGTLAFSKIGGPILPTLDGEYCRVYTLDNRVYSGTILSNSPAVHVFKDASTRTRDEANMHIRLDEIVKNEEDVKKLGIRAGDYICYDTKTVITGNGFIKGRFLDDKLSAAILLTLLKHLRENNTKPRRTTKFLFSVYEEVGFGMSSIPADITELLSVDMGCIGLDLGCTEYDVSICAKDAGGPYDRDIVKHLVDLAERHELNYAVDVYPFYSSDTTAALGAGNDIRGGLIGAGVAASHGMERSHRTGVENTYKLLLAYLTE